MNDPEKSERLAVHAVIPRTEMNGPGVRYGIWVQGCSRCCPGCFNPKTLPPPHEDAGEFIPLSQMGWARVSDLLSSIETEHAKASLEGVSISGGEPFDQPIALRELLIGVRKLGLGILIYTGFTIDELRAMPEAKPCFEPESLVDILVDGPYDESRQVQGELRGSANQRLLILTDRYTRDDLVPPGNLECIVKSDGTIYFTGFHRPPSVS